MRKIGLSSCFFHADPKRPIFKGKTLIYLEQSLANWAMSTGCLAYMIPPVPEHGKVSLRDLVTPLDGLILSGGSDVSPKSYGEEPIKPEWNGDYIRDQYEISLINEFTSQGKPVLGVCRGAQLMNVAFGGTLYQDIEMQVKGARVHRNWDVYDQLTHEIDILPGTKLAKIFSEMKTAKVNTIHHQGLKNLGKDLVVEAKSKEDGMIEAIRHKSLPYVFAVQWHPEFHDSSLLNCTPILNEFIQSMRS